MFLDRLHLHPTTIDANLHIWTHLLLKYLSYRSADRGGPCHRLPQGSEAIRQYTERITSIRLTQVCLAKTVAQSPSDWDSHSIANLNVPAVDNQTQDF
jgi:hypothetical protein